MRMRSVLGGKLWLYRTSLAAQTYTAHMSANVTSTEPDRAEAWWTPLSEFLIHVLVGSGVFAITAAPAVALSFAVESLAARSVNPLITTGLQTVEYAIFVADIFLVLVFLVSSTIRTTKKLWHQRLH